MAWLMMRTRRTLALLGYEYPPSYLIIAHAAYCATVLVAAADRVIRGLTGADWLLVLAALTTGLVPTVAGYWHRRRIWKPMLTVMTSVTVGLFWLVPLHGDVAVLLLVICAAMSAAVTTARADVVDAAVLLGVLGVGVATGRVEQGWLTAAMICFGVAVGRLLQAQLLLLRRERQARASQAVVDRAEMAREIHDVVAHSLSIVLLNVTGARRALQEDADTAEALDALRDAEEQGRAAMADVRRTIELLRTDGGLDDVQPGVADLDTLIGTYRRAGTSVAYDRRPLPDGLTNAVGLAVYRIVQESLANASRHAPGTPIEVSIGGRSGGVEIVVVNDVADDARRHPGGSGLSGMRTRAELLAGQLSAGRRGRRWRVEAFIPATEATGDRYCPLVTRTPDVDARTNG